MDAEFQAKLDKRRAERMAMIDGMSPELRTVVHDYGYTVVVAYLQSGVSNPRHIRHCVETTLNELSPARGAFASQGTRPPFKGASA